MFLASRYTNPRNDGETARGLSSPTEGEVPSISFEGEVPSISIAGEVPSISSAGGVPTLPAMAEVSSSPVEGEVPSISIEVEGDGADGFRERLNRPTREVSDVAGLFEGVKGLTLRRLGAEGSFSTLSVRGAASGQSAFRFAGVPLTGGADPTLDLSTLPWFPGFSATAHKTFAPLVLGGGYLGGLIRLEPLGQRLGGLSRTEVWNRVGSLGQLGMALSHASDFSDYGSLGLGLTASRAANDYDALDPDTGLIKPRDNAGFAGVGLASALRLASERRELRLSLLANARREGIAGPYFRPTRFPSLERERLVLSLEGFDRQKSGRTAARLLLRVENRLARDPLAELGPIPSQTRRTGSLMGLFFGQKQRFEKLSLELGVEPLLEVVRLASDRVQRLSVGTALDFKAELGETMLTASARFDGLNDRGSFSLAPGRSNLSVDLARSRALWAAHLGVARGFSPAVDPASRGLWGRRSLTLAAHVGLLARPPNFLELMGDGGVFSPSPALANEKALSADVGIRGRLGEWTFECVAFGSELYDLIAVLPTGLATQRAENLGRGYILGIETQIEGRAGWLSVRATDTLLVARDLGADRRSENQPLPGRPPIRLRSIFARASLGLQRARARVNFSSAFATDSISSPKQPSIVRPWPRHPLG